MDDSSEFSRTYIPTAIIVWAVKIGMVLVYVIAWVAVIFRINSTSNAEVIA